MKPGPEPDPGPKPDEGLPVEPDYDYEDTNLQKIYIMGIPEGVELDQLAFNVRSSSDLLESYDPIKKDAQGFYFMRDKRYSYDYRIYNLSGNGSVAEYYGKFLKNHGFYLSNKVIYKGDGYWAGYNDDRIPMYATVTAYPVATFAMEDDIAEGEYTLKHEGYEESTQVLDFKKSSFENGVNKFCLLGTKASYIKASSESHSYELSYMDISFGGTDYFNVAEWQDEVLVKTQLNLSGVSPEELATLQRRDLVFSLKQGKVTREIYQQDGQFYADLNQTKPVLLEAYKSEEPEVSSIAQELSKYSFTKAEGVLLFAYPEGYKNYGEDTEVVVEDGVLPINVYRLCTTVVSADSDIAAGSYKVVLVGKYSEEDINLTSGDLRLISIPGQYYYPLFRFKQEGKNVYFIDGQAEAEEGGVLNAVVYDIIYVDVNVNGTAYLYQTFGEKEIRLDDIYSSKKSVAIAGGLDVKLSTDNSYALRDIESNGYSYQEGGDYAASVCIFSDGSTEKVIPAEDAMNGITAEFNYYPSVQIKSYSDGTFKYKRKGYAEEVEINFPNIMSGTYGCRLALDRLEPLEGYNEITITKGDYSQSSQTFTLDANGDWNSETVIDYDSIS